MNYISRLKIYCKKKQITQRELSVLIDKEQTTISKYFNEKASIYSHDLEIIIKHYRINPVWLFFGMGPMEYTEGDAIVTQFQEQGALYELENDSRLDILENKLEYHQLSIDVLFKKYNELKEELYNKKKE